MIAALFVAKGGCYFGIEGVEPWDKSRDARTYVGPHPVVAHPPCERWGRYWGGSPTTWPRLKAGDDNGCFATALHAVLHGVELPSLKWGSAPGDFVRLDDGFHSKEERARAIKTGACRRLSKNQRAATPLPFRDMLISIARTAKVRAAA